MEISIVKDLMYNPLTAYAIGRKLMNS